MPLVKTASDALEDYILNGRPDSEYTEIFLGISPYAIQRDIKFPESEYLFPARDGGAYSATRIQNRFRKFYELFRRMFPKNFCLQLEFTIYVIQT